MSEFIKSYLQAKKNYSNKKILTKQRHKPAEKNINFALTDIISYNLIDNMTMFKNNEIKKSTLNQLLISNLSIFFTKGKIDKKNIKKTRNKINLDNKKCSIKNYGIYFPTKRVMCLEEIKINNKEDNDIDIYKKYKKGNNLKIPFSNEYFETFLPLGRNFLNIKYNINKEGRKIIESSTYELMLKEKNSKNTSFYDNENSASLISEESLISNKDLINIDNKESLENNKSAFRNLKKFKKYNQLKDYIECPLKRRESIKEEYNNFINLLKNFDDLIENKNEIEENLLIKEEFDINNAQKIVIDDLEIIKNNINIEQISNKNNLISGIYEDKNYKSVNESKYINSIANSSMKNDFRETLDKTESSLNQNKSQLNNNKIDKDKEISVSLQKKYLKRMNDKYIFLIKNIYMKIIDKCSIAKSNFLDDIIIKKLFIQIFKGFLLNIGISNKKIYEKILKTQIFNSKILSFDQFIQCFDSLIYDNENENLIAKFSFLLSILTKETEDDFLNTKDIELFFDLLGCNSVYIQDFCESLGERLVLRFNAIYQNYETENIIMGKYRLKKMKIVLESFFDELQIDD